MSKSKMVVVVFILAILIFLTACAPENAVIYFKDGTTTECEKVYLGETFTICEISGAQDTYQSNVIDHIVGGE